MERNQMRKLFTATAVCALAVGLTVAPGAVGKKSVKRVTSTVTLTALPTTINSTATPVTVTGNVKANSSCRKNRTVHFHYLTGGNMSAEMGTATTRSNGDFSATLAAPSPLVDGTTQVHAVVDETFRKKVIKGKKKGATQKRKFLCLQGEGLSNALVTDDPTVP